MDAFEIVRRRASELRRSVPLDPDTPGLEVARALAEAKRYHPIPLVPEDPLLQGAEAVLDRGVRAIFYRRSAGKTETAALIAHELGHLVLHQGLSLCHAEDVGEGEPGTSDEAEEADESEEAGESGKAGEAGKAGGAVHRLDGYGARERQELQANVFARELLLPRSMARRLFHDDGLGARQIAERLALPLEMVRQQLCDALLLPGDDEPDPEAAEAPDDLVLDAYQREAAEHLGTPLLLEAGPGTGKTRTLVARVLFLLKNKVDPASILALTFSNKAAQEIVERVARHGGDSAGPTLFAGTFHAFGLEILRKHHDRVGLSPDLRVVDRADAIALLEEKLPTLGLKHHQNLYEPALELKEILAAVSRAKDELTDAAGYTALAEAMARDAQSEEQVLEAEKALEVARVYEVYEQTLRRKGWVDFGDLVMIPTLLLETDPAVRAALRLRYRHLLVDEYQDVNRAGARLLKALAGDGERLWVVGDSRQSIYRFRGASSANMRLFTRDFPRARRKALGVGYRSTAEIVQTFTSFARTMSASEGMLPLDLRAHRGEAGPEGRPLLVEAADPEAEVAAVAEQVRRLADAGIALRDQGVLCRSNAQVERFAAGLAARGLQGLHLGSLFERSEVRDLLSLLSLVVDPRGGALARLAAMPEYAVPAEDVRTVLDAVAGKVPAAEKPAEKPVEKPAAAERSGNRENRITALALIRRLAGRESTAPADDRLPESREARLEALAGHLDKALSPAGRQGLRRLAEDLGDASPTRTPWTLLADYLLDRSSVLRRRSDGSLEERMKRVAIHQFLGFVKGARPGGRGFPARRLLNRIRRLVLLGEERDLRQMPAAALHLDAVRLMTLHGSKGLEFEAVHLPSLYKGGFPSSFRPSRCPVPPGLITEFVAGELDDGEARDSKAVAKALHQAEEECLFFVAASRARTHLTFYRPLKIGKQRRNPSAFLDALRPPPRQVEVPEPATSPTAESNGFIPLRRAERLQPIRGRDLETYERCPRRFFYSRVFDLPGDRRDGAYRETQNCFYGLMDWMRERPEPADEGTVRRRLDELWQRSGPTGHAFENEYRRLLDSLVDRLLEARRDLRPDPEAGHRQILELAGHGIELEADLVGQSAGEVRVLRLVQTGRRGRSFKADKTVHALWQQATTGRPGRVEVVHLADGSRTPVQLTARVLKARLATGRDLVDDLLDGKFPAHRDASRCPRCPYFFVCPTVPEGAVTVSAPPASDGETTPPADEKTPEGVENGGLVKTNDVK